MAVAIARRNKQVASVLVILGVLLLLSTILLPWFAVSATTRNGCARYSEWFEPSWVTVEGTGAGCPISGTASTSYSGAGLPETGDLYSAVLASIAASCVFGGYAAFSMVRANSRPRGRVVAVVAVVAVLCAGLGPTIATIGQPSTICNDAGFVPTPLASPVASGGPPPLQNGTVTGRQNCNGWVFWTDGGYSWSWNGPSGPWNSFAGGIVSGGSALNWAPSWGWYLSILGTGLLAAGAFYAIRENMSLRTDARPSNPHGREV